MEAIGIVNRVQDHIGKAPDRRWVAYIEAMRGPLSSIPPDSQKSMQSLRIEYAEARFFEGRNLRSVNRSTFHLTKMLKRQSG